MCKIKGAKMPTKVITVTEEKKAMLAEIKAAFQVHDCKMTNSKEGWYGFGKCPEPEVTATGTLHKLPTVMYFLTEHTNINSGVYIVKHDSAGKVTKRIKAPRYPNCIVVEKGECKKEPIQMATFTGLDYLYLKLCIMPQLKRSSVR